jgi:hypothetical protein
MLVYIREGADKEAFHQVFVKSYRLPCKQAHVSRRGIWKEKIIYRSFCYHC